MRKKWLIILVLTIIFLFFWSAYLQAYKFEMEFIKSEFEMAIGIYPLGEDYLQLIHANMMEMIKIAPYSFLSESQFFVYVDRNPKRQLVMLCFYINNGKRVKIIGADKISTGNPNRKGYFITPIGFFENTTENFGYRALGTKNDKGWRGLGAKGSRIWDFGWQKTLNQKNEERIIRLLLHATDPDFGEKRLGQTDSKGCIRTSARMNKFLDYFGILDKEYENQNGIKKIAYLLRNDRKPINFAGKYLVVGDSINHFVLQ